MLQLIPLFILHLITNFSKALKKLLEEGWIDAVKYEALFPKIILHLRDWNLKMLPGTKIRRKEITMWDLIPNFKHKTLFQIGV